MRRNTLAAIAALMSAPALVSADTEPPGNTGLLDFNFYPYRSDVDTDSVFTINAAANLPGAFSYFGFVNFSGQEDGADTNGYYAEQTLFYALAGAPGLDLSTQLSLADGEDNDKLRFGVRWRANSTAFSRDLFNSLNLRYTLNLHLLQLDHDSAYVWQLEHAFYLRMPMLSERLYFGGFVDHTFNENLPDGYPASPVVAEAQLGYRLWKGLHVIGEYRINQYRRSDVNNFAAGLEYKILF